jgi:type IV pilus assembly protein PilX
MSEPRVSFVLNRTRESGVVLLIALIAMVAMALSAIAVVRAVDATTAITGNIGFRQTATSAPDYAIEEAIAALFEQRLIADPGVDDVARSYFASQAPGEDVHGAPPALAKTANYPREARVIDAGNGNAVRYVIERMCLAPGAATAANCTLIPGSNGAMTITEDGVAEPPRVPLYRQTIRVDGPAGTTLFAQAWIADIAGRRRISWRAIAD